MPFTRWGRVLLVVGVAVLAAEVVAILLFGWGALPGFVFFFPIIFAWKPRADPPPPPAGRP